VIPLCGKQKKKRAMKKGSRKNLSKVDYFKLLAYLGLSITIIFFMFFSIPDSILYAKRGLLRWLPFFLIFFGIPYFLFKALAFFHREVALTIGVGSVLLLGPLFGIQCGKNEKNALEKDGIVTIGYISEKWEETYKSSQSQWRVKAKFKASGRWYETFSLHDKENKLKVKDKIEIIYSKRNPEINNIYFMFKNE
jgi:hypothetical protein